MKGGDLKRGKQLVETAIRLSPEKSDIYENNLRKIRNRMHPKKKVQKKSIRERFKRRGKGGGKAQSVPGKKKKAAVSS